MSAEHTPGPWLLETVPTSCGICHKIGPFPWRGGKQNHACIYVNYPGTGAETQELEANARLIAAAPDLLAALEGLCENGHDLDCAKLIFADGQCDCGVDQGVAAIAKAKGGLQ